MGKGGKKGGGGAQTTRVVEYYMSMHLGLCWGPVDAITEIIIGEKSAWTGEATALTQIFIQQRNLFGGLSKEGGVYGNAYYLPGSGAQVMPENLASRLGRSSATCPGFRGQTNLFFCESGNYKGFMWGANQPYLRPVWSRVRRMSKGLSALTARIGNDTNPAHIIFECLTNSDWGMGSTSDLINVDNFEAVATTLYNEGFGLSMVWTKASKVEDFISEVLDHIQANLFIDPQTGLYTLKLIRDDFDVEDLPVFGPDNCDLSNYQVKGWGETVNEIVVTFTNANNEEEETISVQNIANIAVQGGQIVSDSRNYYGIRNGSLAATVAGRDLQSASAPLRSADMEVNRKGWFLTSGSPIILNWPEYGIESLVMRVGTVDYGKPGDGTIKVSLLEDIFKAGVFIEPPSTEWVDPSEAPAPMEFRRMFSLPAAVVANVNPNAGAMEYPEAMVGVLAAQVGEDTSSYQLNVEALRADGTLFYRDDGRLVPVGYATLEGVLAAEATTISHLPAPVNGRLPQQDGFLFLGNDTDENMEICLLRSFASGPGWTIDRGIFDTVPRVWPIGTPAWYVPNNTRIHDSVLFAGGDELNFKLQPRTSQGLLPIDDAPVETYDVIARSDLPNRPGNVKVESVAFGEYDALAVADMDVTWANRNRLMEDVVVVRWADGNVVPEVGQTTTIKLLDADDLSVITTFDGLTGTLFTVDKTDFGPDVVQGIVKVTAKRDGLESLQGHEIQVKVRDHEFTDLEDVQPSYVGHALKFVQVNAAGTGLIFVAPPTVQIGVFLAAIMTDSQVILRYVAVEAWKLNGNLVGSKVNVGVAATAPTVVTIKKNGSSVGTISITGTTPTLATTAGADVSFAAGDILEITGPAVADSSLAGLSIVLLGPKV